MSFEIVELSDHITALSIISLNVKRSKTSSRNWHGHVTVVFAVHENRRINSSHDDDVAARASVSALRTHCSRCAYCSIGHFWWIKCC